MMKLIHESLLNFNVKCRASDPATPGAETSGAQLRLRIGGMDRRKVRFKGWVNVENFVYGDVRGSFVLMQRDEVILPTLTDAITSECYKIPGFTAVLATAVEGVDQARRYQPTRFEEIGFTPCANHLTATFIRRTWVP